MRRIIAVVLMTVTAIYPFILFFGHDRLSARSMALMLCALMLVRALFLGLKHTQARLLVLFSIVIFVGVFLFKTAQPLRWYPVMVSVGFLLAFAYSLRYPPSIIERMARLTQSDLAPSGVRYTRAVTQIWCGFFVLNAALSSWTIYLDNLRLWTVYNGFISYLLMGCLFVGEWLYRPHYRKRFESEGR